MFVQCIRKDWRKQATRVHSGQGLKSLVELLLQVMMLPKRDVGNRVRGEARRRERTLMADWMQGLAGR